MKVLRIYKELDKEIRGHSAGYLTTKMKVLDLTDKYLIAEFLNNPKDQYYVLSDKLSNKDIRVLRDELAMTCHMIEKSESVREVDRIDKEIHRLVELRESLMSSTVVSTKTKFDGSERFPYDRPSPVKSNK